jgi:CheY-like chemotaxis protein
MPEESEATRRILVVDDDLPIRLLVSRVLSREGYAVDSAENGAIAVERIAADHYDAIILDFMMPVMDGLEVLDWIHRQHPGSAKECVIVLTAASTRDLARFDPADVFAVVRKPFDLDDIISNVKRCIEHQQG